MSPEFGPPLIYRLSPGRRRFLLVVWATFTLPLLIGGLIYEDGSAIAAGLLAGLILGLVFGFAAWRHPRLELTPRGIALVQLGYRLEADWPNCAELRLTPGGEGLVLRSPMTNPGARRFASAAGALRHGPGMLRLHPPEILEFIAARRYIPMEAFAHALRHGDLARRMAMHAPWLAPDRGKAGEQVNETSTTGSLP